MIPCSLINGKVSPCIPLSEALQLPGGRGTKIQGVEFQTMLNMKNMDFSRHLVVLKSGKHSKKGIVFNFCPFCRAELLEGVEAALIKPQPGEDPSACPTENFLPSFLNNSLPQSLTSVSKKAGT